MVKLIFVLFLLLAFSACSENKNPGELIIKLRSTSESSLLSKFIDFLKNPESKLTASNNLTLQSFDCFVVNATGEGMVEDDPKLVSFKIPSHCSSSNNFSGSGKGVFSPPTKRGNPIKMTVLTGQSRRFDVYAGFPSVPECKAVNTGTGRSTWYKIGSVVRGISKNDSVVDIPIAFSQNQTWDVKCSGASPAIPTANALSFTVNSGSSYSGSVTGSDPDGDFLSFSLFANPTNGSVTLDQNTGLFTYTPSAGYSGSDSFKFKVSNGDFASTEATVSVTVSGSTPSLSQSTVTVSSSTISADGTATITLTARKADGTLIGAGGATVAFTVSGGTSTGAVSGTTDNGDGTYTATFTGYRSGTATTVNATIGGSAVTSTMPTITVNYGSIIGLVVIMPGQTFVPGVSSAGSAVTGAISPQVSGTAYNVVVHGVDSRFNIVGNATNSVTLVTNDAGDIDPGTSNLISGTYTFSVNNHSAGIAHYLTATSSGLNTYMTGNFTVTPGVMSQLVVIMPGQNFVPAASSLANAVTGAITSPTAGTSYNIVVKGVDSNFNVDTTATNLVSLSTSDTGDTDPTPASLASGTVTITANNHTAGSGQTVTASASGFTDLTTASFTVLPGAVSRLLVIMPGQTFVPGASSVGSAVTGSITSQVAGVSYNIVVKGVDANFNLATASNLISLDTSDPSDTEPSDNNLTSGTATFSVTNLTAGASHTITATSSGLTSYGTGSFTVTAGTPNILYITGGNSHLVQNHCTSPFTVTTKDAYGNISNVNSSTTINLSQTGTGSFYSDSSCTSTISSFLIGSGSSTGQFYFKDVSPGTMTLTASSSGFTSGTANFISDPLIYGSGADGDLTLSSDTGNAWNYALPSGRKLSASRQVTNSNAVGTLLTVSSFTSNEFQTGDEIFWAVMGQGNPGDCASDLITGSHGFSEITAVATGQMTINPGISTSIVPANLDNMPDQATPFCTIYVVRVAQLDNLTFTGNASITVPAFDFTNGGGILPIKVRSTLVVNSGVTAKLDLNGKGYFGGEWFNASMFNQGSSYTGPGNYADSPGIRNGSGGSRGIYSGSNIGGAGGGNGGLGGSGGGSATNQGGTYSPTCTGSSCSITNLSIGGGGGATTDVSGGYGGGLAFLAAKDISGSGTLSIEAKGDSGLPSSSGFGSGGGAGGAIKVHVGSSSVSPFLLLASGGSGGGGGSTVDGGGGGGGGTIYIEKCNTVTTTTDLSYGIFGSGTGHNGSSGTSGYVYVSTSSCP